MLKLPRHNRYDHVNIYERKDYSWPGEKRLAFYIACNVEHFAFGTGLGADPAHRGGQLGRKNSKPTSVKRPRAIAAERLTLSVTNENGGALFAQIRDLIFRGVLKTTTFLALSSHTK